MTPDAPLDGRAPHPPGLTQAVSTLVDDATRLVRLEVQLARQELKELLQRNAAAAGMLVAAAVSAFFVLIMAQVLLVVAIPHHAVVAAIIVAVWLVAGIVLALVGKARLKIEPPQRTLASLKEDLEWVKQQIKPGRS